MPSVWKPNVTVAALIERKGRFLLVEENTVDGVRLNQPAGHLESGESIVEACVREALEETAHAFTPTHLLGVYLWRSEADTTWLRFAFTGELGAHDAGRALDSGIVRTLWLSGDELNARAAEHRSPLVTRCIDDYRGGRRYPIDVLYHAPEVALAASAMLRIS